MTQWVYKAARARATYVDAHHLAVIDHFLCSAIFARALEPEGVREIEMVAHVGIGDEIHCYYETREGLVLCTGTFEVVDGRDFAGVFDPCVGYGAAVQVRATSQNRSLLDRLRRSYWQDPKHGAFTGWAVRRRPTDFKTPGFNRAGMFPSPSMWLWRYPDLALTGCSAAALQIGE